MTLSQRFFNCKQAQEKFNHCSKKEEKRRKREGEKKIPKMEKPKDVGHFLLQRIFYFCACPSHNVLKRNAGGKKGQPLCCKHIFDRIKGNLAEIQPKTHQNVHRMHFLQKVPGVNGLTSTYRYIKNTLLDSLKQGLKVFERNPSVVAPEFGVYHALIIRLTGIR